jgi:hypothetical protein
MAEDARIKRSTDLDYRARHVAAVIKSRRAKMERDPEFAAKLRADKDRRRKAWRANPVNRQRELARDREWRKANWSRVKKYKHKCGALQVMHVARRHAAKLQATPAWSETADIARVYEEARMLTARTGVKHEVDHIVPLRGKDVCGLHVIANLRVITKIENVRKHNKLVPEIATAR